METIVLLAKIGTNATIIVAGLLQDTFDGSFMDSDYIFWSFRATVVDLFEGITCHFLIFLFMCGIYIDNFLALLLPSDFTF